MNPRLSIVGVRVKNYRKYKKMIAVYNACVMAEVSVPYRVAIYFGDSLKN